MAIKTITLLDGTTAYAHDVEDLVNPLYTDIDDTNIRLGAAIQIKKLEASTNVADIIVGNATKVPTYVAMSGDATIDQTGKVTVSGGNSTSFTPVDDVASTSNVYPVWVTGATGNKTPYISTTKFIFNPANAGYANVSTLQVGRFLGNLTGDVIGNLQGNVTGNCSGTSGGLAAGTYSYGSGATIVDARNASGNAATVTNGVYTNGSYADPAWITSLAGSKIAGLDWDSCWVGGDAIHDHTSDAEGGVISQIPGTIVQLTSGSGNWTVPAGITRIKVIVVGGGGGGGGGSVSGDCPGGGGGGTIICDAIAQIVATTPGSTIAYSVGAGGAGGYDATAGADGTASTFGAITGPGGGGGYANSAGMSCGGLAAACASGQGGGSGTGYMEDGAAIGAGGNGGGAGGNGGHFNTPDGANGNYGGGGGGGGLASPGAGFTGGNGGSGIIIIEY